MLLNIAQTIPCTEAEGPERRFAVWFQGCPLRCPGCCNPETLPFAGGEQVRIDNLIEQIREASNVHGIKGITLLGGEPFAHAQGASVLAGAVQKLGLSVMVFSGYTLEELQAMSNSNVDALLAKTDILVDGPYVCEMPETKRRWIGSANQRIHFLTDRYRADDPCWQMPNTIELRLTANELVVNGFPSSRANDLWKQTRDAKDRFQV